MSNKATYPVLDDFYSLIGKQVVLNVLQENLDKLTILQYVNGWTEDDQTVVEYTTVEEQCQVIKNDDVLPPNSKDEVDLLDFRRDCSFIQSTIQKTYDEIQSFGTSETLSNLIGIFHKLEKEQQELLEDTKKKEEKFLALQLSYHGDRMTFKKENEQMTVNIGNLKDEIKDFEEEAILKKNYVQAWQNAKMEMNISKINSTTGQVHNSIKTKQTEYENEERIHLEIQNIFHEFELDIQKQIVHWKLKHEREVQILENKIKKIKEAKDAQQEQTEQMIKKYIQRKDEMTAYEAYKLEQEKKRLENERKNKAATKIQAWWRGVMVRKGFGKYKKKKDRKNKKQKTKNNRKNIEK
ncbi:hypothetical protein ABEB36_002803 [Hypothenemus hampei]|uniref:Dynein regulatory complex protein 9 n=1 Tax=Hypothenemus hampei TaxID=57062 RepID=A0ABD1F710_HYPHA